MRCEAGDTFPITVVTNEQQVLVLSSTKRLPRIKVQGKYRKIVQAFCAIFGQPISMHLSFDRELENSFMLE